MGSDDPPVDAITKDVRDVVPADLEGFEAIIHLAALSNDPLGELKPEWTYAINHQASVTLARAAKQAGVKRYLYSSSCSIYGVASGELATEEAPLRPLTHYAISKVKVEEDLTKLADQNFSPVFLRNATVYGVSPRMRIDLVLNNLVAWAFSTGKIRLSSDGTPWRPIAHVEDISRAFVEILTAPREVTDCQAFNIGRNSENYQIKELAQIVNDTLPDCQIEYANTAGPDPRSYRVDFSKLSHRLPTYKPRWNARTGVEEILAAYREAEFNFQELQGRKYIRLNQLKHLLDAGRLNEELRWDTSQIH
jgi:nucleoside-diphosphate-sugar epimerase